MHILCVCVWVCAVNTDLRGQKGIMGSENRAQIPWKKVLFSSLPSLQPCLLYSSQLSLDDGSRLVCLTHSGAITSLLKQSRQPGCSTLRGKRRSVSFVTLFVWAATLKKHRSVFSCSGLQSQCRSCGKCPRKSKSVSGVLSPSKIKYL